MQKGLLERTAAKAIVDYQRIFPHKFVKHI